MEDSDVINAFVVHLRGHGYPDLCVDAWPDRKNRNSSEIDAIAGPFAIEHTSIDTLPNQRGESAQFMNAVGEIGLELPKKISFRLNITIEYTAVKKGQDWDAIRRELKKWISNRSMRLSDGSHVFNDIPGIPFRLHVRKGGDRPTGVFFSRFIPPDETLPNRIKTQFDGKAEKLSKYKTNKTAVLLIESDDIALMSESLMLDSIQKSCPKGLPSGVDQIWYADTSIPGEIEFSRIMP